MRLLWITSSDTAGPAGAFRQHLPELALETVPGAQEGLGYLRASPFDAVLADLPLPGWSGDELIEEAQRINAHVPVVVRDAEGTMADAVRLVKLGAFHYLGAEAGVEEVAGALEAAWEHHHSRELALVGDALAGEPWKKFLVGESRAMKDIGRLIRLVGGRRSTVLITGETGTGKEMVARALHTASPRSHLPMVAVNCTALPENLLEAELFGHVKGAFTGAINHRVGRFEQAHRSTIFLDEIGDMPLEIQAKLLRVLQEREFQRIGSSETVRVDVRVLAASNIDLAERIRQGKFREDLYYRLNVVPLHAPPLRERLSDIPLLVHHFMGKIARQESLAPKCVSRETLDRLAQYVWPGNVRQLENAVEMAIALSGDRETLYPADFPLPAPAAAKPAAAPAAATVIPVPHEGLDFEATVGRIERQILEQALRMTGGNKTQAADMLRLKRTTLAAKLRSLDALAACY